MNILSILAHPEQHSFTGALYQTAVDTLTAAGHQVHSSDLYRMGFEPVSGRHNFSTAKNPTYFKQQLEELHASETGGFSDPVESELQKLEACDLMIWHFPLWWFSLPAILKGWVDRVFVMGRAYGGGRTYEQGVFRGKRALLTLTTGGSADTFRPGGSNGDLMGILRPIHRGILEFTGFEVLAPQVVYAPVRMDDAGRAAALAAYAERLTHVEQETPIQIGRY